MKIAVPDFITNSYFPAVAAVELDYFKEEGIDMELEHIFPVNKACEVMRDGGIDFGRAEAGRENAGGELRQGLHLLGVITFMADADELVGRAEGRGQFGCRGKQAHDP